MFLRCCFYSVVLCYANLCSVVTACFEDMTPVTHLHPERVTDCVPVSRLFAPSPCLDCSRLEITLSLPHSAITSHSPLFPVGASRSYPSSPWYQPPPTCQHLASYLLFTCDQLFPLTTDNLFWFSLAPLSTFCVHELVGLVWSGLVGLLVVVVPEQWWQRYWRPRQVVSWLWSRVSPTCRGGATRKYFEYSDTRRCNATERSLSLCKNVPLSFSFSNANGCCQWT